MRSLIYFVLFYLHNYATSRVQCESVCFGWRLSGRPSSIPVPDLGFVASGEKRSTHMQCVVYQCGVANTVIAKRSARVLGNPRYSVECDI